MDIQKTFCQSSKAYCPSKNVLRYSSKAYCNIKKTFCQGSKAYTLPKSVSRYSSKAYGDIQKTFCQGSKTYSPSKNVSRYTSMAFSSSKTVSGHPPPYHPWAANIPGQPRQTAGAPGSRVSSARQRVSLTRNPLRSDCAGIVAGYKGTRYERGGECPNVWGSGSRRRRL